MLKVSANTVSRPMAEARCPQSTYRSSLQAASQTRLAMAELPSGTSGDW
jgi:hypothetical protein